MDERQHTPEPWEVHAPRKRQYIKGVSGAFVLEPSQYGWRNPADAHRAVACVNACKGLADPQATIMALRDALQRYVDHYGDPLKRARAALALVPPAAVSVRGVRGIACRDGRSRQMDEMTNTRRHVQQLRELARWKSDDAWRLRVRTRSDDSAACQEVSDACHAGAEALDSCCALCAHDTDYAECKANWRRPIVGVYWKEQNACSQFVRMEKPNGQA